MSCQPIPSALGHGDWWRKWLPPGTPQRARKTTAESNSWNRKDPKKKQGESCLSSVDSGRPGFFSPKETPKDNKQADELGSSQKERSRSLTLLRVDAVRICQSYSPSLPLIPLLHVLLPHHHKWSLTCSFIPCLWISQSCENQLSHASYMPGSLLEAGLHPSLRCRRIEVSQRNLPSTHFPLLPLPICTKPSGSTPARIMEMGGKVEFPLAGKRQKTRIWTGVDKIICDRRRARQGREHLEDNASSPSMYLTSPSSSMQPSPDPTFLLRLKLPLRGIVHLSNPRQSLTSGGLSMEHSRRGTNHWLGRKSRE